MAIRMPEYLPTCRESCSAQLFLAHPPAAHWLTWVIMRHDYWRPPPRNARGKETLPGRHRKAYGLASLLYLPRRKRSYCPGHRNTGKDGRALECPLYQLFYEGEEPPKLPNLLKR